MPLERREIAELLYALSNGCQYTLHACSLLPLNQECVAMESRSRCLAQTGIMMRIAMLVMP